jgi:sterol desaturase/sphingolipid hydroxylase (fatty acid hydroxylase superfamily)
MSTLIYLSIPWFIATMLLEAVLLRRARAGEGAGYAGYEERDTLASLSMGLGNVAASALVRVGAIVFYAFLYGHRLFEIGTGPSAWLLLFFAEDLTYYLWHRASHGVRWLWAAHVNHHSSERFNLSTALRQSWTTPLTLPLFYFWLPLAGFRPDMVLTQVALSLLYQYWVHTELIGTLGPLEWVLNTPSHHRVHHGVNVDYLDRNHAGILIVWDRLFGTFAPEREKVVYGLTKNIRTFNPLKIAFHEWRALAQDLGRARTVGEWFRYAFAPPGWSPDGSTLTAGQLRRATERMARERPASLA